MPLSQYEKELVLKMLDKLDASDLQRILATLQAFIDWLRETLYLVYCSVRDKIKKLWKELREFYDQTKSNIAKKWKDWM